MNPELMDALILQARKERAAEIARDIESTDPLWELRRLTQKHGRVWNTKQLQDEFTVESFAAPLVIVTRKADKQLGSLEFQHHPRFYFNFEPAPEQ